MNPTQRIPFDNSYVLLSERFFSPQSPTPVAAPSLIRVNHALARQLGIDPEWMEGEEALQVLAGNRIPDGAQPIATAYAGHQFGGWNPQLGDGRAVLLGEVIDGDGERYDIQLKGAGQTPYSRRGDGRSPLGPVLREYIVSEAMAALGIPTSRSLAAVATGEQVARDSWLPGAVLTRVARSHIRIGTFQYFSGRNDIDAVRELAQHVITRHYPEAAHMVNPYQALLEAVIARQAYLIAQWQQIGFIHGVMNTDNMLVSGETIDYGPCAFMDTFRAEQVYSSIDTQGRYAYRNQPAIAQWNLSWLAQALMPLLADDEAAALPIAQQAIDGFVAQYESAYAEVMLKKIGLRKSNADNLALIDELLKLMAQLGADYTLTFRRLAERINPAWKDEASIRDIFELPDGLSAWLTRWQERLTLEEADTDAQQQLMFSVNPAFIPRNHLVEQAIVAATSRSDFQPFNELVDVLANPYRYRAEFSHLALPPRPEQIVSKTFCGT